MDGSDRGPTPGFRQRAGPAPRRSPYTAQMRVSPQPMGYPIGVGIGAIGVHTSGTSSPGSSARHPTVRASSRRREATGTCLDEVTPLGPTPEGRPIKAGIHPLHLGPCRPLRQSRAVCRAVRRSGASSGHSRTQPSSLPPPLPLGRFESKFGVALLGPLKHRVAASPLGGNSPLPTARSS